MASIQKRPNGMWRARYRDPDGREHAAHRATKREAQLWLDEKTAQIVTGTHVDPQNARTTVRAYFDEWSTRQVWAAGTATAMSLAVRTCNFSDRQLGALRRSDVEAWI